jgi:hypothetical protein
MEKNYLSDKEKAKRINKIADLIKNNSKKLKLESGSKNWFCYRLDITELFWDRNMMDGYEIHVYYQERHIGTIIYDGNLDKVKVIDNYHRIDH